MGKYMCEICGDTFTRKDVAKDHFEGEVAEAEQDLFVAEGQLSDLQEKK